MKLKLFDSSLIPNSVYGNYRLATLSIFTAGESLYLRLYCSLRYNIIQ